MNVCQSCQEGGGDKEKSLSAEWAAHTEAHGGNCTSALWGFELGNLSCLLHPGPSHCFMFEIVSLASSCVCLEQQIATGDTVDLCLTEGHRTKLAKNTANRASLVCSRTHHKKCFHIVLCLKWLVAYNQWVKITAKLIVMLCSVKIIPVSWSFG